MIHFQKHHFIFRFWRNFTNKKKATVETNTKGLLFYDDHDMSKGDVED
jgi:hypothetical protein